MSSANEQRRVPLQQRSRKKVSAVLDAAEEVLGEHGLTGATMSAIAERSGVPLGSIYQYFPDLRAITRALLERFSEEVRDDLPGLLAGIDSEADARNRIRGAVEDYYRRFRERPGMRAIWTGANADPALAEFNLEDSRLNGASSARALRGVSSLAPAELERRCFLVAQLTGSAVSMAAMVGGREGDRLISSFAAIATVALVP